MERQRHQLRLGAWRIVDRAFARPERPLEHERDAFVLMDVHGVGRERSAQRAVLHRAKQPSAVSGSGAAKVTTELRRMAEIVHVSVDGRAVANREDMTTARPP